jgi:hypothetical protein
MIEQLDESFNPTRGDTWVVKDRKRLLFKVKVLSVTYWTGRAQPTVYYSYGMGDRSSLRLRAFLNKFQFVSPGGR